MGGSIQVREDDVHGVALMAAQIADRLGEHAPDPRRQVYRIVQRIGVVAALELQHEAVRIAAQGGMVRHDGQPRTLSGIFFQLVRTRLAPALVRKLFVPRRSRQHGRSKRSSHATPAWRLAWAARVAPAQQAIHSAGGIESVKIILTGRPAHIVVQRECVILGMQSTRAPSLPRGVPIPPETPALHIVYISRPQWERVAPALQDERNLLVVEGYGLYDPELTAIALYAMAVSARPRPSERTPSPESTNQSTQGGS